ncbi:TPA: hypothetical protein SI588_002986 [Escherichia coli]|uniref:hypothetical protein n=1 Tax=Escherichia coli TaxID=562 RepID=UPI000A2D2D4A|nr:hypothetical protein [Escherichia coli]EFB4180192.1 hypothetical protein [Escherichia coli O74]EES8063195.1 hypothetical protein [Escherichia coli]EET4565179.1 hypothetical protein [Escherichia coli]EEU4077556.1 hypothetical protein [Escherichia coli]EEV6659020.1 hypothetical protein [Escherichia coli]
MTWWSVTSLRWHYPDQVIRVFLTIFCYQLIINKFLSTEELKTSKLTTQLTTHFVEALRTTTNNNKQKGNLLAVLLNRYHFPAIRHEAGGCFFYADLHSSK